MTWMVPCGHLHAVHPRFDLTLRLVLGNAVAFLDAADELVLLAADDGQIVFGQLAPLLLHLAGQLLPIAFDAIPIHVSLLSYADVLLICRCASAHCASNAGLAGAVAAP